MEELKKKPGQGLSMDRRLQEAGGQRLLSALKVLPSSYLNGVFERRDELAKDLTAALRVVSDSSSLDLGKGALKIMDDFFTQVRTRPTC